ncbi:MAG: hypothetical protein Hals2KO_08540 [Halioglobus sp.]
MGSGRSGTASLTSLFNRQQGGLCFHEMNPSCAVFAGNPQSQLNTIAEFSAILSGGDHARLSIDYSRQMSVDSYTRLQQMQSVNLIGDIAFYYLSYVEEILRLFPQCKFVCIQRDREETVQSWLKKSAIQRWPSLWLGDRIRALLTRTPFHTAHNYWQSHDGSVWKPDPVWDSAFPKFDAPTRVEAIGQYWDFYYREAERLQSEFAGSFRIFDVQDLSNADGQREILAFIGLDEQTMVVGEAAHLHKSGA